jgi:hypothetical protein
VFHLVLKTVNAVPNNDQESVLIEMFP